MTCSHKQQNELAFIRFFLVITFMVNMYFIYGEPDNYIYD